MQQYDQLFEVRGSSYDKAMRHFPKARQAEFAQVIEAAGLQPGDIIGDVPAGGGYLRSWLPEGCQYLGHEPCGSFAPHQTVNAGFSPLLPLPWQDHTLDVVVSLAGIHHVTDKAAVFDELYRVTRPGGRLVLSDVAEDSCVARFLDGFVGQHNSTGHHGHYLNHETCELLKRSGWIIVSDRIRMIPWHFRSERDLACFCTLLFDIRRASADETLSAVDQMLGIERTADGRVALSWSLRTIVAEKAAGKSRMFTP